MAGFLIATHGGLARGILDSIELIAGKQERIDMISILHGTSIDAFGKELTDKIVELDDDDGMVVFRDLLLTSPHNQATINCRALQGRHEHRIMSGANLPIILKVLSGRMQDPGLDAISRVAQSVGKEGIQELFEEFARVSNTDMIQQKEKRYEQYSIGTN